MFERGLTAGNEAYPTEDAVEFGLCRCGAGSDKEDDEENEVPLFRHGDDLLCSSCCADRDEAKEPR